MLKIECDCGQRVYLEYMCNEDNKTTLLWDIDTMSLEYSSKNGLQIKCPHCKKVYDIIRIQ